VDQALVQEEVRKRYYLASMIGSYVANHFEFDKKSKLKRGQIQKEISAYFKLVPNNVFCEIVNIVMKNEGFMCRTIRGNQYYRFAKRK
jgi:hypothetical protein